MVSTVTTKSLDGPLFGHAAVDITFGCLLLVFFIVSCICNPIVFWCNRTMKQTIPAILYQILSISDFLTCVLFVPLFLYTLLWTTDPWAYKPYKPWQQYLGILKLTVACMSNTITSILGVLRAIMINRPLISINIKAVLLPILFAFLLVLSCTSSGMFSFSSVWQPETQLSFNMMVDRFSFKVTYVLLLKYFVDTALSFGAAFFCVMGLCKSSKEKKRHGMTPGNERRGVITIIYLNILVVLQFMFIIICLIIPLTFKGSEVVRITGNFISLPFSNSFLSAVNPCITITRSEQIMQRIKAGARIFPSTMERRSTSTTQNM